jgi:hypothetical protein
MNSVPNQIRILTVDDHPLLREGIAAPVNAELFRTLDVVEKMVDEMGFVEPTSLVRAFFRGSLSA